jgi:hypothetical protein
MKKYFSIILTLCLIFTVTVASAKKKPKAVGFKWQHIEKGLSAAVVNAPKITRISDSKVTILKIDPKFFKFELVAATEHDSLQRSVKEWSEMKGLVAAINAGMYGLDRHLLNMGYMKNYNHVNNPKIKDNYKAMAVFNPVENTLPPFQIIDLANQDWNNYKNSYNSFSQCMRMIDNKGKAVEWIQKYKMRCSMSVLAVDKDGNVLFIFTRTPYTPNEFSKFLLSLPIGIHSAMYLEGGPEASLYVNTGNTVIEKFGSYVSRTYAHDRNDKFRKMPNVIGIRRKS